MVSLPEPTTSTDLALLLRLLQGVHTYELGRPLRVGMPQSPNHPSYTHTLVRRHGDQIRPGGDSAANDLIMLGTHVGTHIDALCHVSHHGQLAGGVDAADAQRGGRFSAHGIETVAPLLVRGVLLDIPAMRGVPVCPPGYEITPMDLADAQHRAGVVLRPGDVVLVRSGWGQRFDDGAAYLGRSEGVPGVSEAGADWLARHRPLAVGADTIAFERLAPGAGHSSLPAHRVLLVEYGIHIIETLMLEELSADAVFEFLFIALPLRLVGATGSPLRPLAVVPGAARPGDVDDPPVRQTSAAGIPLRSDAGTASRSRTGAADPDRPTTVVAGDG